MSTPNLGITYIQAAQNQKETTANNAFLALDEALCQPITIAMADADFYAAGGGSPAVTNMMFNFTGTLSDNRNVFLPTNPKLYVVQNNTVVANQSPVVAGKNLTFRCPDGSPAVFGRVATIEPNSGLHLLYCDGSNVDEIQVSQENGYTSIALSDANLILTISQVRGAIAFTFTGALSDNRTIMLPSVGNFFLVKNNTTGGKNLTFGIPSNDSPAVFGRQVVVPSDGMYMMLYTDGVNVDPVASVPEAMFVFAAGLGSNNQVLYFVKLDRKVVFPAGAQNSFAAARTAATGSTTYTFKRNGIAFATVNFGAGQVKGIYTQAADAVFAPGDTFEVDGPAVADSALANVGFTLQMYRF